MQQRSQLNNGGGVSGNANDSRSPLGDLQSMGRNRRSYSLVTSLERLQQKLKQTQEEKKEERGQSPLFIKQKRFIGEITKEVLIVTEDGCYTSRTD